MIKSNVGFVSPKGKIHHSRYSIQRTKSGLYNTTKSVDLICKRHSRDFVKYTQTIIYYTGSIVFLLLINNNNIYIMLESFKTLIIILLLIIVFSLSHNSPEGKISAWNNVLLNFSHFFPNLSSFFFYNNSLISWSFSILFTPMDSPRLALRLIMIDSRRP